MGAVLLIVAVIVFVLAGFGVTVGEVGGLDLIAFGLAFLAASFLVGSLPPWPRR